MRVAAFTAIWSFEKMTVTIRHTKRTANCFAVEIVPKLLRIGSGDSWG
jgi:hypothetical protein